VKNTLRCAFYVSVGYKKPENKLVLLERVANASPSSRTIDIAVIDFHVLMHINENFLITFL